MSGSPFKAILFDLGHTLIHFTGKFDQVIAEASQNLAERLRSLGFPLEPYDFATLYQKNLNTYYVKRNQDLIESGSLAILEQTLQSFNTTSIDPKILAEALKAFFVVTQRHWQAVEHAPEILDVLFLRGYRMGIISNASNDCDVQLLVEKAGIRPCLEFVLTSAAVGYRKPHPLIFQRAVQALDLPPGQIALVGDQLDADILGGNQASLHTIWVTAHQLPQHSTPGVLPTQTITNLSELLDFFPEI